MHTALCAARRSMTHIGRLFIVVDVMNVPGQAEVSDLHDVAFCDQDVPCCQVSVYTLGWTEGEGGGEEERGGEGVEKMWGREE